MPLVGIRPLVQVVLHQTMGGQAINNVFEYIGTQETDLETLEALLAAIEILVFNNMRDIQSDDLVQNDATAVDLNGFAFAGLNIEVSGSVAGDRLPTTNAVSVKLNRASRETRSGFKRFAGISESQTGGDGLDSDTQEAWKAIGDAMLVPIPVVDNVFEFVIVSRKRDEVTEELLPVPEWVYQIPQGAGARSLISTQKSRQRVAN